jgi:hypothetical protein
MPSPAVHAPSRGTLALLEQLDQALIAFGEARRRREEAEGVVRNERFKLKTLTEEAPLPIAANDIRKTAEREQAIAAAKVRVDAAVAEFLAAAKEVETHAVEAHRAHRAATTAVERELDPVRHRLGKAAEEVTAELMAVLSLAAVLNEVVGRGRFDAVAHVNDPLDDRDLAAYVERPELPAAMRQWQRFRSLRTQATSIANELPLAEAAE